MNERAKEFASYGEMLTNHEFHSQHKQIINTKPKNKEWSCIALGDGRHSNTLAHIIWDRVNKIGSKKKPGQLE